MDKQLALRLLYPSGLKDIYPVTYHPLQSPNQDFAVVKHV